MFRINWKSVGAVLVTVFGIVSSPAVLHLLPAQASGAIALAGAIIQAVTHPVAQVQGS